MNDNVEKVDLNRVDWKSSREFFESLGEALDKLEDKDESYDFTWVGKRKSIIEAGAPIDKILRPDVEASKDFDNTKNMLIVGDNLDALKLLQESYLGKIKMIYIDPPYNTGHDFVYHDNFTVKKADFEDDSTDSDGNVIVSEDEYAENSKANGRFHSDWLSMMYPRLKLARNLLTDDGVIFISIDDNEQANLKKLCDEIFGEDNFIDDLIWQKTENIKMDSKFLSQNKDHILIYRKTDSLQCFLKDFSDEERFRETDEKGKYYLRKLDSLSSSYSRGMDYVIEHEGVKYYAGGSKEKYEERQRVNPGKKAPTWLWSKEKYLQGVKDGEIVFKNGNVYNKVRYDGLAKKPFIDIQKVVSQQTAQKNLDSLMDGRYFDHPKPPELLEWLFNLVFRDSENYVLDFFAGSGTIGHAICEYNAKNKLNNNFIAIQLDEPASDFSKSNGYDTIDQITAERLRRAGEKIKSEHPEADIDTGFRVFRADGSNDNENIRKPLNEIDQSDMFDMIDNVKKDRTPLDLLFGIIYTSALPFDLKLETRKIGENTVYMYGYLDENTGLVACFDDEVPEETVKEIAKLNPLTAAFKDSSFKNSAEKINLSEHFRIISPDTRVKVI